LTKIGKESIIDNYSSLNPLIIKTHNKEEKSMKKKLNLVVILMFVTFFGACAIAPKEAVIIKPDALEAEFTKLQEKKDELAFQAQENSELVILGFKNNLYGIVFNSIIKPTCIDASWYAADFKCRPNSRIGVKIDPLQIMGIYSYLITIDPKVVKRKQFQVTIEYTFFGKNFNQLFFVHNDKRKDIEPSEED